MVAQARNQAQEEYVQTLTKETKNKMRSSIQIKLQSSVKKEVREDIKGELKEEILGEEIIKVKARIRKELEKE